MRRRRKERAKENNQYPSDKGKQSNSSLQITQEQINLANQVAQMKLAEERRRRRLSAGPQLPPISVIEYTGGFKDPQTGKQVLLPNGAVASTYLPKGFDDKLGLRPGGLAGPTKMAATDGKDHFETVIEVVQDPQAAITETVDLPSSDRTEQPQSYPPQPEANSDTLTMLLPALTSDEIEEAQYADEEQASKRMLHLSLALTGLVVVLAGAAMVVGMTVFAQNVTGTSTNQATEQAKKQAAKNETSPSGPDKARVGKDKQNETTEQSGSHAPLERSEEEAKTDRNNRYDPTTESPSSTDSSQPSHSTSTPSTPTTQPNNPNRQPSSGNQDNQPNTGKGEDKTPTDPGENNTTPNNTRREPNSSTPTQN